MTDDTTTVYLSEGALAQKRCYHTDPDGCQSIAGDEDVDAVTKDEAENELDLRLCRWCDDDEDVDQSFTEMQINSILRNADPSEGWAGVRKDMKEVRAND